MTAVKLLCNLCSSPFQTSAPFCAPATVSTAAGSVTAAAVGRAPSVTSATTNVALRIAVDMDVAVRVFVSVIKVGREKIAINVSKWGRIWNGPFIYFLDFPRFGHSISSSVGYPITIIIENAVKKFHRRFQEFFVTINKFSIFFCKKMRKAYFVNKFHAIVEKFVLDRETFFESSLKLWTRLFRWHV